MKRVHQVLDGPYETSRDWYLVCIVEEEGKIFTDEVYFNSFNEAYKFMGKLEQSIEPLTVKTKSYH